MKIVPLEAFPPGNPFHHDGISVGMDLADAVMNLKIKGMYIMSSGMHGSCDFYIVDTETGERFGIKR